MKMMQKKKEILFVGILVFMGLSLSFFRNTTVGSHLNDGCNLSASWVGYDNYGECHFHNIGSDYVIEWSFRSTQRIVNITAIAMDTASFTTFESSRNFEGSILSNGTKSRDSGTFRPPNDNTWFIVFWHNDSDTQLVTWLQRSTDKIYELEGNSSLNEIEFTETIILTKFFQSYLEWHDYYNDYRDHDYTAKAIFYVAGDNVSMSVKVEHVSYIDHTKIIARNKNNNSVIEHRTTPDHNITILNYKDWTFEFYLYYKYVYLGCINWGTTYCYEEDWKTTEGIRISKEYDFEEKNTQTMSLGFLFLLTIVISIAILISKTNIKYQKYP